MPATMSDRKLTANLAVIVVVSIIVAYLLASHSTSQLPVADSQILAKLSGRKTIENITERELDEFTEYCKETTRAIKVHSLHPEQPLVLPSEPRWMRNNPEK